MAVLKFFLGCFVAYLSWYVLYEFVLKPETTLDEWVMNHMVEGAEWGLEAMGLNTGTFPQPTGYRNRVGVSGTPGVEIGAPCDGLSLFALFAIFIAFFPGPVRNKLCLSRLGSFYFTGSIFPASYRSPSFNLNIRSGSLLTTITPSPYLSMVWCSVCGLYGRPIWPHSRRPNETDCPPHPHARLRVCSRKRKSSPQCLPCCCRSFCRILRSPLGRPHFFDAHNRCSEFHPRTLQAQSCQIEMGPVRFNFTHLFSFGCTLSKSIGSSRSTLICAVACPYIYSCVDSDVFFSFSKSWSQLILVCRFTRTSGISSVAVAFTATRLFSTTAESGTSTVPVST